MVPMSFVTGSRSRMDNLKPYVLRCPNCLHQRIKYVRENFHCHNCRHVFPPEKVIRDSDPYRLMRRNAIRRPQG